MIGFRSGSQGSIDGTGPVTCNAPAGVTSGDVLVGVISTSGTSGSVTEFASSGWTLAAAWNNGGNSLIPASGVLWKPATSSEPSSYTFSKVNNTIADQLVVHVGCFTGVDTSNPFAVTPIKSDQAPTERNPVPAPSITIPSGLSDSAMLVTAYIASSWYGTVGAGRWTPPSGMTEMVDYGDVWTQMGSAFQLVGAGATGVKSATLSQAPNQESRGISLALRPVATAPAVEPGRWFQFF